MTARLRLSKNLVFRQDNRILLVPLRDTVSKMHKEAAHKWAIRSGVQAAGAGINGLRASALNNPKDLFDSRSGAWNARRAVVGARGMCYNRNQIAGGEAAWSL